MNNDDVYEMVTAKVIEKLESGVVPWHRPWAGGGLPMNMKSRKEYKGMNVWLLGDHSSPWWGSMKQINDLGGKVLAGEKSSLCVFNDKKLKKSAKDADGDDESESDGKGKYYWLLKYYRVFNIAQTTLKDDPRFKVETKVHEPIKEAAEIVDGMPSRPVMESREASAFYRPSADMVNVPELKYFESAEEYYSVVFHELTHSTGHSSRLGRKGVEECAAFGSATYSEEELVAEMGAAFLCGKCGIERRTLDNSAAYIAGWLNRLKDDRRLLVKAAGAAQKAADFILGVKSGWKESAVEKVVTVQPAVEDPEPVAPAFENAKSDAEERLARLMRRHDVGARAVGVLTCRGFDEDAAMYAVARKMELEVDVLMIRMMKLKSGE